MRVVECEQGSPEWIAARIGIPTASAFDKIITPKTRKPSASASRYLARLCAEWFLGISLDDYVSGFMERGSEMEESAVAFYEFDKGLQTSKVGLCLRDDGKVGASPDRLVGDDGALEIKCPSAEVHMSYLLNKDAPLGEYWCQLQGELWVAERKWVDLLCFHPTLPRICTRIVRDEEFIGALAGCVGEFVTRLDEAKASLRALREEEGPAAVGASEDPFCTE